ncbi:hypothetical protein WDV85_14495 [Pseudokineococcus sp. 5B2Z-1]|uniref:hypothetical protein n=1 Tax=Pseudokineococcus sp. 5B2Z-1 TaxID=3132744 RepID=UPI0030B1A074
MRRGLSGRALALVVVIGAVGGCSSSATPSPRASDLSTLGVEPDGGGGGDLLCGAIPADAAERVTSGQRILDSDGEVLRYPDGGVGSARCEVYVSGQQAPAIRLVLNTAVAGGQDAVLRASSGGNEPLPEAEGIGYVGTGEAEPESEGGAPLRTAGGELLVETQVPNSDAPLRILIEVKVTATGRDQADDVAALLGQVRRSLDLVPLMELPADVSSRTASAGPSR